MPSGIYGSRSIIPNNYYFTFDYIYDKESSLNNSDNILIGRCVLAREERTVWLKTTNGYIQVAKLDNEARFKYLEGFGLEAENCIDDILSYGNTPHGNGTYIINFDKVSQKKVLVQTGTDSNNNSIYSLTLKDIDWKTHNQFLDNGLKQTNYNNYSGTWPNIQGLTQNQYLRGSTFLLYQYTESKQLNENNYVGFKYGSQDSANDRLKKIWNNKERIYVINENAYEKITGDYNTISTLVKNENVENLVNNESKTFYILQNKIYNIFQILTDITQGNNKQDVKSINHFNKTFMRKGVITYTQKDENDNIQPKWTLNGNNIKRSVYYSFDTNLCDFVECSSIASTADASNYYTRTIDWGDWEDTSEQYTGYVGNLDPYTEGVNIPNKDYIKAPYPYSKDNIYFNNSHVKVLLSEQNFNNTITQFSSTYYIKNNNNQYELAKAPFENNIIYYIQENNNFNQVNNLTENDFNETLGDSVSDTYYVIDKSRNTNTEDAKTLVDSINKIDKILGSNTRLLKLDNENNTLSQVNSITNGSLSKNLSNDYRYYYLPESNIIDAIVHHDADIGFIERFDSTNGNTYNFHFDRGSSRVNTNGFKLTDSSNYQGTAKWHINSLSGAIRVIDNVLGGAKRLGISSYVNKNGGTAWNVTGSGSNGDKRPYKIEETNIIDAIVHHDADIGEIETQLDSIEESYNLQFVKGENEKNLHLQETNRAKIYSLTDAIQKIDRILGSQQRLKQAEAIINTTKGDGLGNNLTGNNNNDNRPYKIAESNIIDTIVEHAADIGELELLTNANTYNLSYNENVNENAQVAQNNIARSGVHSLVSAIRKLDNVLGSQRRLGKTSATVLKDAKDNSGKGDTITGNDANQDERTYILPETNLIDAIVRLATDIGQLQDPQYNFDYIKTSNNHSDNYLWSLSEAIKFINDKLIGNRNDLQGQNNNLLNTKTLFDNLNTLNEIIGNVSDLSGNNAEQGTSLVNKIQAINSLIGIISDLNGNGANQGVTQSLVGKIQAINNSIGTISDLSGNNAEQETSLVNKIQAINSLIGIISDIKYKDSSNIDNIPLEGSTLIEKIQNIINMIGLRQGQQPFQAQLDDYIKLINNLAENVDYLEILITQLQKDGGTGTSSSSSTLMWQTL